MTSSDLFKRIIPSRYSLWLLHRVRGYIAWLSYLTCTYLSFSVLTSIIPIRFVALIMVGFVLTEIIRSARVATRKNRYDTGIEKSSNYQVQHFRNSVRDVMKFGVDICLAATLTIVMLPLMLIISALVKLDSPGPVFSRYPRVGLGGRVFVMFKFRTQSISPVIFGERPRVTRLGLYLRRTSLNELPQILNVLRGEMSLVGHRPVRVPATAINVSPYYYMSKPGITGLTGITYGFRDADEWYVKNWSIFVDIKIMLNALHGLLRIHSEQA